MSQATLEIPALETHYIEAEAASIAAAEHQQHSQAPATESGGNASTISNDFINSLGLDEFRDTPIPNPHGGGESYTLGQIIGRNVCPALPGLLTSMHRSMGEGAVKTFFQAHLDKPERQPKPDTVPEASPVETAAETARKQPKDQLIATAAVEPTAVVIEQPAPIETKPAVTQPITLVVAEAAPMVIPPIETKPEIAQPAGESKPEPEVAPAALPLPAPAAERATLKGELVLPAIPESNFVEAMTQPPAKHVTLLPAKPGPVSQPAKTELFPAAYPSLAAIDSEPVYIPLETTAEPEAEISPSLVVDIPEILPAEPIDLSEEVNALLIELGLRPNIVPEPSYADLQEATLPEGAIQLPPAARADAATIETAPVATHTTLVKEPAEVQQPELPVLLQTELAERLETLSLEQIADIQPVADALLQAAIEIDELHILPAATAEQQAERLITAEEKLETLCAELLRVLGLPADNDTVTQFSRYLLKTEQFRHILRIGRQHTEAGTHERLRSSLAWLQHLAQFIKDQAAACRQALGWSALRLSTPPAVA